MAPSEAPAGDEFYVLKQGGMHGPFTRAELQQRYEGGVLSMEDFVQAEGVPIWQPLARILGSEDTIPHGAIAPDWRSILTWAWMRLRFDLDQKSIVSGWVCLGIGLVALLLSRWTVVFWLPWVIAALVAALALWQRRRITPGAVLLAAAIGLPLLIFAMQAPKPAPSFVPAIQEPIATTPAPEKPAVRVEPPPPAPVEAIANIDPLDPSLAAPPPSPPPAPVAVVEAVPQTTAAAPQAAPAQPIAPPPLEPAAPTPVLGGGDFVQQHRNALVVVKDRGGSGSGFVAKFGGKTWLFTNIHVAAGMAQPQFTRIDGVQLKPGIAEAAVDHDAMRIALTEPPAEGLEIMTELDAHAKIGDAVFVLGNSGGGGVITALAGTIIGIGPDRIEVSAEFIPGNSGSPIIHAPTGKVIGIATYLTRRYEAFAEANGNPAATPAKDAPGAVVVRRFGYRLDSVKQWQPLNWTAFQGEARSIEQIATLTGDVVDFLDALRKDRAPAFKTAALRRPAETWLATINRPRLSEVDREQATRSFLTTLRSIVQSDVVSAKSRLRYAYFQNELQQEREVRDRLFKAFDDQAKKMSTPSMGRSR